MSQFYADFDNVGNIAGFYVDDIHGDNIPATAILITVEEWQLYAAEARIYKRDGENIRQKTQAELDAEQAARPPAAPTEMQKLKAENTALQQQVAQTNNDLVGFQNFIFEKFPNLA